MDPTIIALIPARGGSARIPRKNIKPFPLEDSPPLLAYTIASAQAAGIFGEHIYVSTEDDEIATVAERYGARVIRRPRNIAGPLCADVDWVAHALATRWESFEWLLPVTRNSGFGPLTAAHRFTHAFALLRPTSPFRSAATIRDAWTTLQHHGGGVHSLRAVQPVREHPFKMWRASGELIVPFSDVFELTPRASVPAHSQPTQAHDRYLIQNAALEMAWFDCLTDAGTPTISGTRVLPWTMPQREGTDLNTPDDWDHAVWLWQTGRAHLPTVPKAGAS